jgi:D-beta-D-heptose 7-phosphate kinase/D-beta-D-heptose 1-phosphate adenosyltransferase
VPVVHVRDESVVLGGAGNVVRNAVALGARCDLVSVVGDDVDGRRVVELLKDLGVDSGGVVTIEGRPTTRKSRVVARSQQVLRFDRETLDELDAAGSRSVLRAIDAALPAADAVVIADYGKGMLSKRLVRNAMRRFDASGLAVFVDPKHELRAYRGAALIKPNLREAEELTGLRVRDESDLAPLAAQLRRRVGDSELVVTRGRSGMIIFSGTGPAQTVKTVPREVFDVQGAGDTIIASLALARRAGANLLEATILANAAAGVVVSKMGTATASPEELRSVLPEILAAAKGLT